jgi:putative ABC transport system substrate-binding protein
VSAIGAVILHAHGRASAQAPAKPVKIGWLSGGGAITFSVLPFLEGLREQGYVDGQNVVVEQFRPEGANFDQYPELVGRLLAGRPAVILAANPHAIDAVTKATKTMPIIAVDLESDPVARGWVTSLARPGGNLSGFFLDIPEISGKQLQFLREVKPGLSRVAVLGDSRVNELQFHATDAAGRRAGLTLHALRVKTLNEIPLAIAEAARQRAGALLALTSPLVITRLSHIAEEALRHRLPSSCPFVPQFAEFGGLLAYGPDFPDLFRRASGYVGRILKGAKVEDLPVQRPAKFELAVNVKTARALGLTLPVDLVQRADRVIE